MLDKVFNLSKAIALQAAAGFPMCSEKELADRNKVCSKCSSYDEKNNKCKECGCFLSLKARLKTSQCPLELWENLTEKENDKGNK